MKLKFAISGMVIVAVTSAIVTVAAIVVVLNP